MTNIQINGVRFTVATAWEVDLAQFSFASVDGGPETDSRAEFDPSGPNAGSGNLVGATINSWTNTLIDIDYDGASHPGFLRSVTIRDVTQTESVVFDVSPDAPTTDPLAVTIANVVSAGPNYIGISGTNLDLVERFRVFDNFALDQYYYDSSGPNAGLNPPGSTVTVYGPTSVIIGDPANVGLIVTQVQARTNPGDVVADEWYGTAIVPGTYTVSYNVGTDELTIDQTAGILDLTGVDFINYTGNGSGQLNSGFFTANSATQIVIPNAAFVLNGGTLTELAFIDGITIQDVWSGSEPLF